MKTFRAHLKVSPLLKDNYKEIICGSKCLLLTVTYSPVDNAF